MKSKLKYVGRIQWQTHTKESKKHIYTQIRGVMGVSWDRKNWNSTQLDQARRNTAAIFESLY